MFTEFAAYVLVAGVIVVITSNFVWYQRYCEEILQRPAKYLNRARAMVLLVSVFVLAGVIVRAVSVFDTLNPTIADNFALLAMGGIGLIIHIVWFVRFRRAKSTLLISRTVGPDTDLPKSKNVCLD